jgi:hypothetical protein
MVMKKMFALLPLVLMLTMLSCSAPKEVSGLTDAQVAEMINSQQFRFLAKNMVPQTGRSRVLTDNYTLNVSKEEVTADLPYIGQAYSAPMNPADAGVRFVSKDFGYEMKPRAKGGWDIIIKPKESQFVRECNLTVFENGNANLVVLSNNRQTISYSGVIMSTDKKLP